MFLFAGEAPILTFWGFILLPVAMFVGFSLVSKSKAATAVTGIWLLATAFLGTGFLSDFSSTPPPVFLVFFPTIIGVIVIALSGIGKTLADRSVRFLIGFQSFRIIVELLIHQAVAEGTAPPQMTWTGYNFDIVTGVTALLLIPFANKLPKWAVHCWNALGAGLLLLVVAVAIVSMPTPFQQLKPDNTWVAYFPFIWLPVVLVSSALLGHLVLFRKLISSGGLEKDETMV